MCNLKLFITILFASSSVLAFSQKNKGKTDTTAAIKEFMAICNQYKKLPLHLTMQHSNSATIAAAREDSATTNADFYMTEQGSYIKYGNVEQIVNDSLMLMISPDQQVMMLYQNLQSMQGQLKNYTGLQMADSSVLVMANGYASAFLPADNEDKGIIELKNRVPLPGTDMVKEVITLTYNTKSKEPEQVMYIRRTLIPVDKAEFDSLPGRENISDKLVIIKDNYFLVNERKGIFDYKMISHNAEIKLPVSITDRIMRNQRGEFIPVKGFGNYHLSVE